MQDSYCVANVNLVGIINVIPTHFLRSDKIGCIQGDMAIDPTLIFNTLLGKAAALVWGSHFQQQRTKL